VSALLLFSWHHTVRHKLPEVRYKTLVIHAMRDILLKEGDMTKSGLQKALHICRGHFRRYDENSLGLFGKYHGTFFIPQHARGNTELGEVRKTYEVTK
jgi:hypothetical protein